MQVPNVLLLNALLLNVVSGVPAAAVRLLRLLSGDRRHLAAGAAGARRWPALQCRHPLRHRLLCLVMRHRAQLSGLVAAADILEG